MSWLLPDTPVSGDITELREHVAMLRALTPRTDEVRQAIDDAERVLAELEREHETAA